MVQYTKIPRSLYLDQRLSYSERILMMVFLDRATLFNSNQEDFFCKEEWLSDVTGFSMRTVKSCVKYLNSNGYLKIKRKGNYNRYIVVEKDGIPYVPVQRSLYMSGDLTSAEKIMLITLMDRERYFSFKAEDQYTKGFGFCCKIEWLGEALGLRDLQVKRLVKSLKDKGMISVTKSGRLNQYTINWTKMEEMISDKAETGKVQTEKTETVKESTVPSAIRQFLNRSRVEVCTPDDDDFSSFIYQETGDSMPMLLWCAKHGRFTQEVEKIVNALADKHYGGDYKADIRRIIIRRVRYAG